MEMLKRFGNWVAEQMEPVFNFFRDNRNSPFLWIGLFLLGVLITKVTYDALNRGE